MLLMQETNAGHLQQVQYTLVQEQTVQLESCYVKIIMLHVKIFIVKTAAKTELVSPVCVMKVQLEIALITMVTLVFRHALIANGVLVWSQLVAVME